MTNQNVAFPRRSRWRKWVVLSLGTLVLLLGLLWYFVMRQSSLGVVQVPGGEVRLVRAVEGRLLYRESDPIPMWARGYIPGVNRLAKPRFPVSIDSHEMSPGDRGPWLVFSIESAAWPMIPPSLFFDRIEIESAGYVHHGTPTMSSGQVAVFHTISIPRRDPHLKMQLFPQAGNPISMTVDNPFYRTDFPVWIPGPMPARATRGPFTVELTHLYIAEDGGAYPVLNCTCTDPTLEPCQVYATLEDPTGNRGPFVSPWESAWKVIVHLSVPNTAASPLNQRFPLGKIQLPPADTVVAWPKSVKEGDLVFQTRAIVGPGTYEQIDGKWQVVTGPTAGNAMGRVQGPAILCDFFRHGRFNSTVQVKSRNGVLAALPSGFRSQMPSKSRLSTVVVEHSSLALHDFSPGDEIELELTRSRSEQFEFMIAPPEKSRQLHVPNPPHLPGD